MHHHGLTDRCPGSSENTRLRPAVGFSQDRHYGVLTRSYQGQTGQGFGCIEVMVLEPDCLAPAYGRVVVGVVIHQDGGRRTFGDIHNAGLLVVQRYTELLADDFSGVADSTATTVPEFVRDGSGEWEMREMVRGIRQRSGAFHPGDGRRAPGSARSEHRGPPRRDGLNVPVRSLGAEGRPVACRGGHGRSGPRSRPRAQRPV